MFLYVLKKGTIYYLLRKVSIFDCVLPTEDNHKVKYSIEYSRVPKWAGLVSPDVRPRIVAVVLLQATIVRVG